MKDSFKRVGIISLEEGLMIYNLKKRKRKLLRLFKKKGYKCVNCEVQGKYFAVDILNKHRVLAIRLFGETKKGEEVLMTHDHIIPRSKGGSDNLNNLQPMCEKCNVLKGNEYV